MQKTAEVVLPKFISGLLNVNTLVVEAHARIKPIVKLYMHGNYGKVKFFRLFALEAVLIFMELGILNLIGHSLMILFAPGIGNFIWELTDRILEAKG